MNAARRRTEEQAAFEEAEASLSAQIHALPLEYQLCRDLRHKWSVPKGFFQVEVEGGVRGAIYVEREVVCERCSLPRVDLFRIHSRWMEKLSYRYDYAKVPNYRLVGPKKGQHVTGMVQLAIYMHSIADFNGLEK